MTARTLSRAVRPAIHGEYIIVNSVTRDNNTEHTGQAHSSGVISIFIRSLPLIPIPSSTDMV